MSIPTAELTIGEITKLQGIFVEARGPLSLPEFIDAFRSGLRKRVDPKLMALLFALIDADDRGVISWAEFQRHVQDVRKDAQAQKDALMAVRTCFEERVQPQDKKIKEFYHTAPIIRVFKPDSDSFLTASADGTVKRWSANTLEHQQTLHFHTSGATDASFEQQSSLLSIANGDQSISIYDVRHSKLLRTFLTCRTQLGDEVEVFRREFRYPLPTPAFTFQGRVQPPELEGSVIKRYWEAQNNKMLQRVWSYCKFIERYAATAMPSTTSEAISLVCHGEHEGCERATLFLGLSDGRLHVYQPRLILRDDYEVPQAINPTALWRPHSDVINRMVAIPEDRVLVTCGGENAIHLVHMERGMVLKSLRQDSSSITDKCHSRGVKGIAVNPSPRIIASWGLERYAILWDPLIAKPTQVLDGHLAKLVDVHFCSRDTNLILTYSDDHVTRVWDMRTFRCLQQMRDRIWEVNGRPGSVYYDEANKVIITATHRLYRKLPTDRKSEMSAAHTLPILALSYCEEQQLLVSCDEGSVRLWDVSTMSLVSKWPMNNVHNVCLESTGVCILVEQGADEVRVFHTSSGQPALVLTGTAKPAYLAEADHRFVYWEAAGFWVVATATQLLMYESVTEHKALMYPVPTFKKELWILTSRIVAMCIVGSRLVVGLQGGEVYMIVIGGAAQPMDPKHQPFVKLESTPKRLLEARATWLSYLKGPLHRAVRRIIVDSNRLRNQRLNIKDAAAILEEIPDEDAHSDVDRVECFASLTDEIVVSGRPFGQLSLWHLSRRRELFRFQVTLQSVNLVTALDTSRDGRLLVVADDSGYVGAFDVSRLCDVHPEAPEWDVCETAAQQRWMAERIHRVSLFRADVGVVSSLLYSTPKQLIFVATTSAALLALSVSGERVAAFGHEHPTRPPANTLHHDLLDRQYRQELLMERADAGQFTASELVAHAMAAHPHLFRDAEETEALLQEMCPDSAERELERLMEKTSAGVFLPLQAKPLGHRDSSNATTGGASGSNRSSLPIASEEHVRQVSLVELWHRATEAFRIQKQTKPFTRKIAGHARLLEELEDAAVAGAGYGGHGGGSGDEATPTATAATNVDQNSGGASHRVAGDVLGGEGTTNSGADAAGSDTVAPESSALNAEPVERSDVMDEEQLNRVDVVFRGLLDAHDITSSALLAEAFRGAAQLHHALHYAQRMFAECFCPEAFGRSRVAVAERRGREALVTAVVQNAARVAALTERTSLARHCFWLAQPNGKGVDPSSLAEPQPLPSRSTQSRKPPGGSSESTGIGSAKATPVSPSPDGTTKAIRPPPRRGRHASSAPPTTQRPTRRQETTTTRRARRSLSSFSAIGGSGNAPAAAPWRRWKSPELPWDIAACRWSCLWVAALEEIPFASADSFKRKEQCVEGLLQRFRERCVAVVEGIAREWRDDKARACRFEWTTADGVHVHCVTNPVSARAAGAMDHAAKAATREISTQQVIIHAQRDASIHLHVPLCCIVRFCGLVFYCSAVIPVSEATDEVPWSENLGATFEEVGRTDDVAQYQGAGEAGLNRETAGCGLMPHRVPPHLSSTALDVLHEATRQVFSTLHMEPPDPSDPSSIPFAARRFLCPRTGRSWLVGVRACMPSLGPRAGDAATASQRMRPEAVQNASCPVASRCFATEIPLEQRRRADRDGIKAIRNLDTVMVGRVAETLVDTALRGVIPMRGEAVVDAMHAAGLNVHYLAAVCYRIVRVCSSLGMLNAMTTLRRANRSTRGVVRSVEEPTERDESGRMEGSQYAATAGEDNDATAPTPNESVALRARALQRLVICELTARTFRCVVEADIHKVLFTSHVASLTSAALEVADKHVDLLLALGSTIPSQQYWAKLAIASAAHFPHGEFADRIAADVCDAAQLAARVAQLCGFEIHRTEEGGRVARLVAKAKSIRYENAFDSVRIHVQHGAEFHEPVREAATRCLERAVGPERWWLERHMLRMAVLDRLPRDVPAPWVTRIPTSSGDSASVENAQLLAFLDASRSMYDAAIDRLRRALASCGTSLPMSSVFRTVVGPLMLCGTLLDVYQWTGQHGRQMQLAERILVLLRDAVRRGESSPLEEANAMAVLARVYLEVPVSIQRHRAARELLVQRREILRQLRGMHDDATIGALRDLAQCHIDMEEEYEAIEILKRVAVLCQQHYGPSHAVHFSVLETIGQALAQVGDFNAAAACFRSTIDRRQRAYPHDPAERAPPHLCLIETRLRQGDETLALGALKAILPVTGGLPFNHPALIKKLKLEAKVAQLRHDTGAAIAAWTKVLDAYERTCGPLSAEAADAMQEIGILLFEDAKYHESWHCFDVCLGIRSRVLGELHPLVATTIAWGARSCAAVGSAMEAVEGFQSALDRFDSMCREDDTASTFPKLKAQALIDMATLLYKDVEVAHRSGTPLDVKRLMVVGRVPQAELRRALNYLTHAERLTLPIVMDPHHASIRAIRVLKASCETLIREVTEDEDAMFEAAVRSKRIDSWARGPSEQPKPAHESSSRILTDALWYRKSHRIYKLKN